ncbi:MAG: hypothetical protein GY824_05200 [Delftia sp.]|nr:hypothetical protein [Delftia sp.]
MLLSWQTAAEIDTYGFRLLRHSAGQLADAVEIAFVPSQALGYISGASYEYLDDTVTAGQTYTYWLLDVDPNGNEIAHGPAELRVAGSVYLPIVLK